MPSAPVRSQLVAACLASALLAGGCAAPPAPPPAPAVSLSADAGLSPADEIDGLDLAVGPGDQVVVAWRERTGVYAGARSTERIVYRRGTGAPLRWGPRVVLGEGLGGVPRMAVGMDGVHLLAGGRLRHWVLPANGGPARALGPLLAPTMPSAGDFRVVRAGDGLLLVYAGGGVAPGQPLRALRWTPSAGAATPVEIAHAERAAPALLSDGSTVQAFWADNAVSSRFDAASGATVFASAPRVETARSGDAGTHWSTVAPVPLPLPGAAAAIAATGSPGAAELFVAAYGLFDTRRAGTAWTAPVRIAQYTPGALAGSAETSAVAAARCHGHAVVAWVDARNRGSDRRWWNPLGGFPWGDNPDWLDNDLFLATRLPHDPREAAALVPERLTAPGSMTREVAIAARGDGLLVVRAGRAKVRKTPADGGAPPAVLQSVEPCE